MAEVVGSRLEWLIEDRRTSQSAVAREIGVSQPSIGRLITGETRETGKLLELARALKTSPLYLVGESDDPTPGTWVGAQGAANIVVPAAGTDDDLIEIDRVDLSYGMGGTFLDIGDADVERVKFSRAWLREFTDAPPERLGMAQGIGDSMEPVIADRDVVVFDRSARLEDHVSDKVWVFAFGQVGMIKRLRPMPDGTVKIMSANRTYPDEIATGDDLHIIGRVVATVRRH